MKVRLSADAREFLRDEARHLRQHSTSAARRLLFEIDKAKSNLSMFPLMGSQADAPLVPGMRRLVVGNYVLDYEIDERGVSITSVKHGAMKPETVDHKQDDDVDYESD